MKKKYLLLAVAVLFFSCSERIFTIGMTEAQFLKTTTGAIQVEANTDRTVYKKVDYGFGHPASVKFFYFQNGVLTKIDTGDRTPDVVIQHTN